MESRFILSKKKLIDQVKLLENLGLKISYSYKTNREVGKVLQEISNVGFSIHAKEEIKDIGDKSKIWFFTQAESEIELKELLDKGINNFVIDNEVDLRRILNVIKEVSKKISLSLRMKFKEHRIGSGKYFVYGMSSEKVKKLILELSENEFIERLGVHIHRKSQNTSEWEIKGEIEDSLGSILDKINFINFGGGLPVKYRSYSTEVLTYIFGKIKDAVDFLKEKEIESYIEPGRFFAAPCINLETEIIQVYDNNIIINTTIYNCAIDGVLTNTKMLIEGEKSEDEKGDYYLVKGNSPTRDDIFRYRVKLDKLNSQVGEKIVFLNAGAYNYTTDFFGYKKLDTEIVE
jgi:ornithine decarboxylase